MSKDKPKDEVDYWSAVVNGTVGIVVKTEFENGTARHVYTFPYSGFNDEDPTVAVLTLMKSFENAEDLTYTYTRQHFL